MKTTGKQTSKLYRCECGHESHHTTNHFGEFYDRCPKCSWNSPMDPIKTHTCLEKLPKGWDRPPNWKKVNLKDVVK